MLGGRHPAVHSAIVCCWSEAGWPLGPTGPVCHLTEALVLLRLPFDDSADCAGLELDELASVTGSVVCSISNPPRFSFSSSSSQEAQGMSMCPLGE